MRCERRHGTCFEPASWEAFARSYNGPLFARNRYHEKLAIAYRLAAADFGIPLPPGLSAIANEGALRSQPRAGGRTKAIELETLGEIGSPVWTRALSLAALAALVVPVALALSAAAWRRRAVNLPVVSGESAVPGVSRGLALTAGAGLLAALVQAAGLVPRRLTGCLLLWAACALGLEAAQAMFTNTRTASPADALASLLGAMAGMAAIRWRGGWRLPLTAAALLLAALLLTAGMAALRPVLTDALVRRAWTEAQQMYRPASPWPGAAAHAALALELPGARLPVEVMDSDRAP